MPATRHRSPARTQRRHPRAASRRRPRARRSRRTPSNCADPAASPDHRPCALKIDDHCLHQPLGACHSRVRDRPLYALRARSRPLFSLSGASPPRRGTIDSVIKSPSSPLYSATPHVEFRLPGVGRPIQRAVSRQRSEQVTKHARARTAFHVEKNQWIRIRIAAQ